MKYHFADLLDREGDYWTIVPNIERFSFSSDKLIKDPANAKIVTVSKYDENWYQIFDLPNLEELTLHEPSKEQVESIRKLTDIKRLRLAHYRTKTIEFLENLINIEELVLEYVSGFSDLSPLKSLTKLKSLHLENLRRVSNFDGLSGINSLRYLHIDGTMDQKQPIESFKFVKGLPNLELLALGFVKVLAAYPAFIPLSKLDKLKRIKIGLGTLDTKDYAFIIESQPNALCSAFGTDIPWKPYIEWYDKYYMPLGKGKKEFLKSHKDATAKCTQLEADFEKYRKQAKERIKKAANTV